MLSSANDTDLWIDLDSDFTYLYKIWYKHRIWSSGVQLSFWKLRLFASLIFDVLLQIWWRESEHYYHCLKTSKIAFSIDLIPSNPSAPRRHIGEEMYEYIGKGLRWFIFCQLKWKCVGGIDWSSFDGDLTRRTGRIRIQRFESLSITRTSSKQRISFDADMCNKTRMSVNCFLSELYPLNVFCPWCQHNQNTVNQLYSVTRPTEPNCLI